MICKKILRIVWCNQNADPMKIVDTVAILVYATLLRLVQNRCSSGLASVLHQAIVLFRFVLTTIIVQFLFFLVKSTPILKIIHHYPEPGHSFLPCDRCFGVIEKFLRKKDYIFNPQQYANCIKQASKSFIPVMVPQNMVLNFSKHYDGHFKKVIVSDTKQRFKISQYKIFKYDKDHPTSISASVSTGFPIFETYVLLRNVEDPLTLAPTTRAYEAPLLLKKPKYEDVMQLARKYVPLNETAYYENLKSQPHGTDQVELISATDDDDQPDE